MQALVAALLDFRLLPAGFGNRRLRERMRPLLGLAPGAFSQGRMNYDLCRLRRVAAAFDREFQRLWEGQPLAA